MASLVVGHRLALPLIHHPLSIFQTGHHALNSRLKVSQGHRVGVPAGRLFHVQGLAALLEEVLKRAGQNLPYQ
jgi:hypothetical protein